MTTTEPELKSRKPYDDNDLTHFKILSSETRFGHTAIGVKVLVMLDREFNEADASAGWRVIRDLFASLEMESARLNPKTAEERQKEKTDIEKCFTDADFPAIYMEQIPNEYWGDKDPMALRSPWYNVATKIGFFKVGWRKRVLVLDWERTEVKTTADTLFQNEDVTKGERMIHCYGYGKATEYLKRVMSSWESCKFK